MIDIHVHLNWLGWTAKEIIKHADEIGIDRVCLLGWEAIDGAMYHQFRRFSTDEILEAYSEYPDRIVPFCAIDPRREDAEDKIKQWYSTGCRGFGEYKIRLRIDNPDSIRIYRLCGRLQLPVLFHMDIPLPGVPFWYNADMNGLERVLQICPDTTFIGHGPGWWREISGKSDEDLSLYPKGPIKPRGRIEYLFENYSNIYADISAGSGLNAMRRDIEAAKSFVNKYSDRILYGTDDYFGRLEHINTLKSLYLTPTVFQAIVHDNAAKILQL